MATYNPPLRATAYEIYVSLRDQSNVKLFKANPTLAAGDVKVSKNGGSLANIATLPTAVASSKIVKVVLSSSEMTADNVTLLFSDAAGSEWCDLVLNIQTVNATLPAQVVGMDAGVITSIQSGLATAAALGIVDDFLDTEIAAILAKVNALPAAPAAVGDVMALASGALDDIADAVWDEALAGHNAAGSAGNKLGNPAAVNVTQLDGSATAATNLKQGALALKWGTAVAGTLSTTQFTSDVTGLPADAVVGRLVSFLPSGGLQFQQRQIVDYVAANGLITVASALTAAVSVGQVFIIQ